eukprot:TRINITY_DN2698_c0_g1_i1.p1 TRINITY_DN2698_c0_g1~~TRINITY_DN2698_c0_g1_i1.p1  ORF type:complete len:164 (+),score=42.29 TRINITY_DN2698_c0_g1_i1:192-683(+)
MENERLNRHIANKPLGPAGQAYLQEEELRAQQQANQRKGPVKHESWVDLHNEYADILDQQELAKFRRHFRAFGANDDGFLTQDAVKDTMETFFGQDLTRQQIQETIAQIDYDGDGQLSYREFLEAMCGLKSGARTKFGSFYKVLTLKNPAFWVQRVGRANSAI